MVRQRCCRGMCQNLLRSYGQQRNYSKAKFSSYLNCGQKPLVKRVTIVLNAYHFNLPGLPVCENQKMSTHPNEQARNPTYRTLFWSINLLGRRLDQYSKPCHHELWWWILEVIYQDWCYTIFSTNTETLVWYELMYYSYRWYITLSTQTCV